MHDYVDDCAYQETINGERTWDNTKRDALKQDKVRIIQGLIDVIKEKEAMHQKVYLNTQNIEQTQRQGEFYER